MRRSGGGWKVGLVLNTHYRFHYQGPKSDRRCGGTHHSHELGGGVVSEITRYGGVGNTTPLSLKGVRLVWTVGGD